MRIAIHHAGGGFTDRWIGYCKDNGIEHQLVDCFSTDLLEQLRGANALLWHWHHDDPVAILCARQIITAVEMSGIRVFPDRFTCWHFDDKVGQKYLLEAIGAPLVPAHVFYDKHQALDWIDSATFPSVFKLRGGAGALNVKLVRTRREAKQLCHTAFSSGFKPSKGYFADARTKARKSKSGADLLGKLGRAPRSIWALHQNNKARAREKGYLYFQDFLPGNDYDIRITVIGNRAFGFTRNVRPNDFRASGSGSIDYESAPERIDEQTIQIAFDVARKMKAQSVAFDFIRNSRGESQIVECSYAYMSFAVRDCPGHWDSDLNWRSGHLWPEDAIIEDVISDCRNKT